MRYMVVRAPKPIPTTGRRPSDIPNRLARNVAVLFGVDVPANPTGLTWVSDYNELTIGEIGRGAPNPKRGQSFDLPDESWYVADRAIIKGPSQASGSGQKTPEGRPQPVPQRLADFTGLDVIAPATLQKFGPETKAALVLTGANVLFSDLEPVMADVLEVLGTSADGEPLADCMRVALWAAMVAEAYRVQPALFVAAVQAREIQRGALTPWRPLLTKVVGSEFARVEFGPSVESAAWAPKELGILDTVMPNLVKPELPVSEGHSAEGDSVNNAFLIEDLINRWCRHLLHSRDRGVSWVTDTAGVGRYSVDAFLPELTTLMTFTTEVQRQEPRIRPFDDGRSTVDQAMTVFDKTQESHRRRVRPRIPSLPEMRRLPKRSQRALLHSHMVLLRVLQESTAFASAAMTNETTADMIDLVRLGERLLEPEDPLVVRLRSIRARMEVARLRASDDRPHLQNAQEELLSSMDRMRELWTSENISTGEWVEAVYSCSDTVNMIISDYAVEGRAVEEASVRSTLTTYWMDVLSATDLLTVISGDSKNVSIPEQAKNLPGLLHDYVGFLAKSPELADREKAIRIGIKVLLPNRREIARQRRSDTALRTTLQVLVRAIALVLPEVNDDSVRRTLMAQTQELLDDLLDTSMVSALLSGAEIPERPSHTMAAMSVASAALLMHEFGASQTCPLNGDQVQRVIALALTAEDNFNRQSQLKPGRSERQAQLDRLIERWETVEGRPFK